MKRDQIIGGKDVGESPVKKKSKKKLVKDQKVTKENNNDEEVDATTENRFPKLKCRLTPKSFYAAIRNMTEDQKQLVTEMGFGHFFGLKIDTLPSKLSFYLVRKFRPLSRTLKFKHGSIEITEEIVRDMFGLPIGGVDMNELPECPEDDPLYRAWRNQFPDGKLNIGNYVMLIRSSRVADDLFRLNFLALFINTFAEQASSGSHNIRYMKLFVRNRQISAINWCKFLVDRLETNKYSWKPNVYFTGPMTLLMLVYADRVISDAVQITRLRPFLTAIDSQDLKRLEEDGIREGGFGRGNLRNENEEVVNAELPLHVVEVNINEQELGTREAYYRIIEHGYNIVADEKRNIENALIDGFIRYPNDEKLIDWYHKAFKMFSESKLTEISDLVKQHTQFGDMSDANADVPLNEHNEPIFEDTETPSAGDPETEGEARASGYTFQGIPYQASPIVVSQRYFEELINTVDSSVKRKLNIHPSQPSFDLGITQLITNSPYASENVGDDDNNNQGRDIVGQKGKGKEVSGEGGTSDQFDGNLVLYTPRQNVISHYIGCTVEITPKLTPDERIVAQAMFTAGLSDMNVVWGTASGHDLCFKSLLSLKPNSKVDMHIIDVWAHVLNEEESAMSSKERRIFCTTQFMTNALMNEGHTDMDLFANFATEMEALIQDDSLNYDWNNVTMVIFPVVDRNRYYMVVFKLKRCALLIIDTAIPCGTLESTYGGAPHLLKKLFINYLHSIRHKKTQQISISKPVIVNLKWQLKRNINDRGVLLMRHMEMYFGKAVSCWDCGLDGYSDDQHELLTRLRYRYMAKMLLMESNILRDLVVGLVDNFESLPLNTRIKMLADAKKK